AALLSVPSLHGVNLPRQRIEAGTLGLIDEQFQLVVGRALADRALDEIDLFGIEPCNSKIAVAGLPDCRDVDVHATLRYCVLRFHPWLRCTLPTTAVMSRRA